MRDLGITLGDGRELAFTDIGEVGWLAVFFFHGAPTTRLHLAYLEEAFRAHKVRVISPDRPGYGRSSPLPGRLISDWPADVEALVDALAVDRFMVAGHSSGGPYALACAALLPERVWGAAVFGGVTDMGWRDAWLGWNNEAEGQIMRMADEEAAIAAGIAQFGEDGSGFGEESDFDFAEPDKVLRAHEEAGPRILLAEAEAFRQGVAGYVQDAFVQGRPWTFNVTAASAPALIIHGELDNVVPVAHSRHTAQLMQGSTLRILPGHGHLTTLAELPSVALELSRSA